jgi:hypothetical protein
MADSPDWNRDRITVTVRRIKRSGPRDRDGDRDGGGGSLPVTRRIIPRNGPGRAGLSQPALRPPGWLLLFELHFVPL